MSTGYAIQSLIEVIVTALLIIGFINEEKVARFERKIFNKISEQIRVRFSRTPSRPVIVRTINESSE